MREEKASADRLAAYSDAVFAVIVTIMVLELKAPPFMLPGRKHPDRWSLHFDTCQLYCGLQRNHSSESYSGAALHWTARSFVPARLLV